MPNSQETQPIEVVDSPLVPAGLARTHTKQFFEPNAKISKDDAADYTRGENTPEKIKQSFLGDDCLANVQLSTGEHVVSRVPTGAYGAGAVLVLATRPGIEDGSATVGVDGRLPTKFIYQFSSEAQREYFFQIVKNVRAVESAFADQLNEEVDILVTDNTIGCVSDEFHRVARTIAEPHAQIFAVHKNLEPLDESLLHSSLRHERSMLRIAMPLIVAQLQQVYESGLADAHGVGLAVRTVPPVGYVISTRIHHDDALEDQAERLQQIMAQHHQTYEEAMKSFVAKMGDRHPYLRKLLLPQPSYKVYMKFNQEGFLEISIGPTLFAQTGVIEALDWVLYRDPQAPPFFASDEQQQEFYAAVANLLTPDRASYLDR